MGVYPATALWLFVWLCAGVPAIHRWDGWMIGVIVCVIIDIFQHMGEKRAA